MGGGLVRSERRGESEAEDATRSSVTALSNGGDSLGQLQIVFDICTISLARTDGGCGRTLTGSRNHLVDEKTFLGWAWDGFDVGVPAVADTGYMKL